MLILHSNRKIVTARGMIHDLHTSKHFAFGSREFDDCDDVFVKLEPKRSRSPMFASWPPRRTTVIIAMIVATELA